MKKKSLYVLIAMWILAIVSAIVCVICGMLNIPFNPLGHWIFGITFGLELIGAIYVVYLETIKP